jgi:hypothetical protein
MDRVADRARLDQGERGRPPGHRLQRRGQADDRALPLGEPGALLGLERGDHPDPALGDGEVGLRGFDPGGERGARGAGAVGLAGRVLRLLVERLGALRRLRRLAPRLRQRLGIAGAGGLRRAGNGEAQGDQGEGEDRAHD